MLDLIASSCPGLQRLDLYGRVLGSAELCSFAPALRRLPNLRHLALPTGCSVEFDSTALGATPSHALETITFVGPLTGNPTVPVGTVEWLTAHSKTTLREVRLSQGSTLDSLGEVGTRLTDLQNVRVIVQEAAQRIFSWTHPLDTAELVRAVFSHLE